MNEFKYVDYEVAEAVATITLARPEKANAQNERMLDEVDHRFRTAEYDDEVKVIVLRGEGKHFSAGHDLGGSREPDSAGLEEEDGSWQLHKIYRWEARKYLGYSWHWRNIPKPTIGAIQGKAIAGAFNLIFPLDLPRCRRRRRVLRPGGADGHRWSRVPRTHLGVRRAARQGHPLHPANDGGNRSAADRVGPRGRAA